MENNNARYIAEFSGSDMIYHASKPFVAYASASFVSPEGNRIASFSDFSEGLEGPAEAALIGGELIAWLTDYYFDADLEPTTGKQFRDVRTHPIHLCAVLDRTIESETGSVTKPVMLYRTFATDVEAADVSYAIFEGNALEIANRLGATEVLRRKFSGSMPQLGRPGEFFSLSATMSFARVRE